MDILISACSSHVAAQQTLSQPALDAHGAHRKLSSVRSSPEWVIPYPRLGEFQFEAFGTMKILLAALVLGSGISLFAAQSPNNSNVPSQSGSLRVNTPKANERTSQNFIHVTYQLVNRGAIASSSPNFTIQLDGNDPITTTANEYTFSSLTPGIHTVTVTLVDANGVPIANSSVATKFTVIDPSRTGRTPSSFLRAPSQMGIADSEINPLPDGGTPLPVLSVVGFAVLIGGICTAARSR